MNDEPGRKAPVQSVLIMGGLSIAYCTLGRVEAGLDPRPLFHSLGKQRADTAWITPISHARINTGPRTTPVMQPKRY